MFKGHPETIDNLLPPYYHGNIIESCISGTTGDWKNHFSAELEQEMNQWIDSNAAEIGITFK